MLQVEDVLRNSERGPGPFVSSTAPRAELPRWAATLQWWWRCRLSKWVFRCAGVHLPALPAVGLHVVHCPNPVGLPNDIVSRAAQDSNTSAVLHLAMPNLGLQRCRLLVI